MRDFTKLLLTLAAVLLIPTAANAKVNVTCGGQPIENGGEVVLNNASFELNEELAAMGFWYWEASADVEIEADGATTVVATTTSPLIQLCEASGNCFPWPDNNVIKKSYTSSKYGLAIHRVVQEEWIPEINETMTFKITDEANNDFTFTIKVITTDSKPLVRVTCNGQPVTNRGEVVLNNASFELNEELAAMGFWYWEASADVEIEADGATTVVATTTSPLIQLCEANGNCFPWPDNNVIKKSYTSSKYGLAIHRVVQEEWIPEINETMTLKITDKTNNVFTFTIKIITADSKPDKPNDPDDGNQVLLSVSDPDHGMIEYMYAMGSNAKFSIHPASDWVVEYVLFNGIELTADEYGFYSTGNLERDSELQIVYSRVSTEVNRLDEELNQVRVYCRDGEVRIENRPASEPVMVCSESGAQLYTGFSDSVRVDGDSPIVIVRVGAKSYKLVVR